MPSPFFLRKPRFALVYVLGAWLFLVAHTTQQTLRLGIAFVLLGELIRLWANGYVGHRKVGRTKLHLKESKIGQLITAGPYAFVRHPLYFGTFLIGAGFCVIVGDLWLSLAALVFFFRVYLRKMWEEERRLMHEWGPAYRAYHRRVPRWLPRWRRYARRHGAWSWLGIGASREWKTLIWLTVLLIVLYFRMEFIQEHEPFFDGRPILRITLLVVLLGLVLTDVLIELIRRRPRRTTPPAQAT